jgi:hypothetical protein
MLHGMRASPETRLNQGLLRGVEAAVNALLPHLTSTERNATPDGLVLAARGATCFS